MGQRPQPQEVHLEEAQRLQVVLVPLDHRAARHRGVLDRDDGVDRIVAQQEAARVDGEVAGRVQDLVGETQEMPVQRRVGIEPGLPQRFGGDVAVVGEEPGEAVERGLREAQRLADVADG